MPTHDLQQGSQAWHEFRAKHFGASEAAAMLGLSKYTTRSELLYQKHTGVSKEIHPATQVIFNRGHETEALARPIIEARIGEALSPVTCSDGILSCSCDGITFDDTIAWEHKQHSDTLFQNVLRGNLPEEHQPQCQQVLMITGAKKLIFTCSDGTKEHEASMDVFPDHSWFERIRSGWAAFHRDLETYVPPEIIPEVVAAPIKDLPAITYKMDGMRLSTNLRDDVKPAILALVEQSKKKLENDQDFADLDALCKKFKQAEEQCALVQSQAVGEIKDVDAFCRDLKELSEVMRQARLAGEKAVTSEKENRKLSIIIKASADYLEHVEALESEIKPILMLKGQTDVPDFAGAIKGMKKLSAMQEAVDNTLRNGKMLADSSAKDIRAKLAWCKENAAGMSFLFPDLQGIISMELEAFTATITNRIRTHKEAEAEREATATARIEAEAKARAEREVVEKMAEAAQAKQPVSEQSTTPVLNQVEDRKSNHPNTDTISAFLKLRDFGKEENKVRAILVEFVKFTGGVTKCQ